MVNLGIVSAVTSYCYSRHKLCGDGSQAVIGYTSLGVAFLTFIGIFIMSTSKSKTLHLVGSRLTSVAVLILCLENWTLSQPTQLTCVYPTFKPTLPIMYYAHA